MEVLPNEWYSMVTDERLNIDSDNNGSAISNSPNQTENSFSELENITYCHDHTGNFSYLNVSCESNLQFSIVLYGYFTPLLLLVTLVANSLIVVVLSKRNMASPTNFVLMGKYNMIFFFAASDSESARLFFKPNLVTCETDIPCSIVV